MAYAKDLRRSARTKLNGKWGLAAGVTVIALLIEGACSGLSAYIVGFVALFLVMGPLTLGLAKTYLDIARKKEVRLEQMFSGFSNFAPAFVLYLLNGLFTFLWSLLFVIPGIVKALSYSMSYYILADHPEMPANDARKLSMEMMNGNKWRLFCLHLSFIGWYLLCIPTFGILLFWVIPYAETAAAEFYRDLMDEDDATASPSNGSSDPNGADSDGAGSDGATGSEEKTAVDPSVSSDGNTTAASSSSSDDYPTTTDGSPYDSYTTATGGSPYDSYTTATGGSPYDSYTTADSTDEKKEN